MAVRYIRFEEMRPGDIWMHESIPDEEYEYVTDQWNESIGGDRSEGTDVFYSKVVKPCNLPQGAFAWTAKSASNMVLIKRRGVYKCSCGTEAMPNDYLCESCSAICIN